MPVLIVRTIAVSVLYGFESLVKHNYALKILGVTYKKLIIIIEDRLYGWTDIFRIPSCDTVSLRILND